MQWQSLPKRHTCSLSSYCYPLALATKCCQTDLFRIQTRAVPSPAWNWSMSLFPHDTMQTLSPVTLVPGDSPCFVSSTGCSHPYSLGSSNTNSFSFSWTTHAFPNTKSSWELVPFFETLLHPLSCVPWSVRQKGSYMRDASFLPRCDSGGWAAWAPCSASGVLDCQGLDKTIYVILVIFLRAWHAYLEQLLRTVLLNALDVSDSTPAIDWMSVSSPVLSHSYVEI